MFPANLRGSVIAMELLRREKMPAIDRSVVADIPLFSGLAPGELDEILGEARSIRYRKGHRRVRAGCRRGLILRAAAWPFARRKDHAAGPSDRGALRLAGRDVRRRAGAGPPALSGDRRRGRRQRRAVLAVVVVAAADREVSDTGRERAADRRQPPAGHPGPRAGNVQRTGRAAVAHALLRLAKQAGRKIEPASRSTFRSAGRTSPR